MAETLPLDLCGARRPWLDLYEPVAVNLLAARIGSCTSLSQLDDSEDEANPGTRVPIEVWLDIAKHLHLDNFRAVCALGSTCHALRPLARHPQLWQRLCLAAFANHGYIQPPEKLLHCFQWSYRTMFQRRKRLRFDGLYFIATTKLLAGLNEGRGMKEADKDFYSPGGRWVTSFRCLRFFPCGRMFSYLVSSQTPADIRKAASMVTPDRPQSLAQKLKGACWGAYDLHEPTLDQVSGDDAAGAMAGEAAAGAAADRPTHITARVILFDERYPRMVPATIRYVMEMRPRARAAEGEADGSSGGGGGGGGSSGTMVAGPSGTGGGGANFQLQFGPSESSSGVEQQQYGANNCELHLVAHAIQSGASDSLESIPVPAKPCSFLGFTGPVPQMLPLRPLAPRASGQ